MTPSRMQAMLLERPGEPLKPAEIAVPHAGPGQILIRIAACGVCRTDLHIFDGELAHPKLPLVPWLGFTDGTCAYCRAGQENLCDEPRFTGYQIDGGYAGYTVADARYVFNLPEIYSDAEAAPLLCAGLIGYRSLKLAREPLKGSLSRLGIYGFGAAAHIVAQVARAPKEARFTPSPGPATAKRRISPARLALSGPAVPTRHRRKR